jgi:hypothetical protein
MPAPGRRLFGGVTPLVYEKLTLSNSTASGVNSTAQAGSYVVFSVEDVDVRVRSDGTEAANSTGVLYLAGTGPYYLPLGSASMSQLSFCRDGASGTATVCYEAYSQPGD